MDFNSNDVASLNIMEYSLCLDDQPAVAPPGPTRLEKNNSKTGGGGNFAKLKSSINQQNSFKFDKQMNTLTSFYLTNDYDHHNPNGDAKERNAQFQNIDEVEDEDEVVFNLNVDKNTTYSQNKNGNKAINRTASANTNATNTIATNSNNNNNNVIELDAVKHKLSSIWNNVKYGKNCILLASFLFEYKIFYSAVSFSKY